MSKEIPTVVIHGGVIEGVVYLDATDVIASLRLTAHGYRVEAAEEDDEDIASALEEVGSYFEAEADEFDLISMAMLTEAVEEAEAGE
jgi:hypothetical protein